MCRPRYLGRGFVLRAPLLSLHGAVLRVAASQRSLFSVSSVTCALIRPHQRLYKQGPCRPQASVPLCAGTLTEWPGKDFIRMHMQSARLSVASLTEAVRLRGP